MSKKKLIVIVGPTAVGKTALCVRLAKELNTEVVSADSRQFYREMQIGTARPCQDDMKGVKHHFLANKSITELYDAASFERDSLKLLQNLYAKLDCVILTGGGGLYIKAVTEGFDNMPVIDMRIRKLLNEKVATEGIGAALKILKEKDLAYYAQVDKQNPQRVVRALEVCLSAGKPFSSFRQGKKALRPFHIIKIGLNRPRAELYERINKRVDTLVAQGLLKEVERLKSYAHHSALQTVGYKEFFDYLDGKTSFIQAVDLIKRNTRRFAKKQLTWFNKDHEYVWFHPSQYKNLVNFLQYHLDSND